MKAAPLSRLNWPRPDEHRLKRVDLAPEYAPRNGGVSRQHCMLRISGDQVHIRDLGSSNGTLVNGARILDERQLMAGD